MSKPELIEVADIPSWAVMCIEYGETEGLSEDEVAMVERYYRALEEQGYKNFSFQYGEEPSFTHYPEFGLPCDCYETEVWGHPTNQPDPEEE